MVIVTFALVLVYVRENDAEVPPVLPPVSRDILVKLIISLTAVPLAPIPSINIMLYSLDVFMGTAVSESSSR